MFTVSLPLFIFGLTLGGLVGIAALWIYYDRRDRRYYDRKRIRHAHYCPRCQVVYSSSSPSEAAPCGRCGHVNGRLRF